MCGCLPLREVQVNNVKLKPDEIQTKMLRQPEFNEDNLLFRQPQFPAPLKSDVYYRRRPVTTLLYLRLPDLRLEIPPFERDKKRNPARSVPNR